MAALACPRCEQEEPAELRASTEDPVAGVSPSPRLSVSPLEEVDMGLVVVMEEATVASVEGLAMVEGLALVEGPALVELLILVLPLVVVMALSLEMKR